MTFLKNTAIAFTLGATGFGSTASADVVHLDDVIITGSLCVGFDCNNGETFGFDTIRLKENNVRIKFDDTSASGSFPNRDWQLTANDSANGGANKFSIDDITGGRTPFTIVGNAPNNALFVDAAGRLGLGTATPSVEIHSKNGDSPTLRLEQDGSSGFGLQTWDVAGNEANFFIRDVTNGSKLPFRIQPGADSNSIYIASTGNIGLGTTSPDAGLHVIGGETAGLLVDNTDNGASNAFAHFRTQNGSPSVPTMMIQDTSVTSGIRRLLELKNNGGVSVVLQNDNSNVRWAVVNENAANSSFLINDADSNGASPELTLDRSGNLTILGTITSGGTTLNVPDYVFGEDYKLMPLNELANFVEINSHLPKIPSAAEINSNGININEMQMALLEKVEELTLYTLKQEEMILALSAELKTLQK